MQRVCRVAKNRRKSIRRSIMAAACISMGICLMGCGDSSDADKKKETKKETKVEATVAPTEAVVFEENGEQFKSTEEYVYTTTKLNVRASCSTDSEVVKMLPERAKILRIAVGDTWSKVSLEEGEYYVATEYLTPVEPEVAGHLIAIDAGHQEQANEEQEPIGPGAEDTKEKNTIGTRGVSSGVYEYQLTLQVAEKLKEELKSRGYEVFMVRESNDFNMSTKERTEMATESGAEILIRLHANGSKVTETNGAMAVCGTKDSPYVADLYEESYRLSNEILTHYVEKTGATNKGIWETDLMCGINWSTVPVSILELGFMSNATEDEKMQKEEYQIEMVTGIADGIDAFFE